MNSELIFATCPHLLSPYQPHSLNCSLKCHGKNVTHPFQSGSNKAIRATKSIHKLTHSIWWTIQSNVYFVIQLKPTHQKTPPNWKLLPTVIRVCFIWTASFFVFSPLNWFFPLFRLPHVKNTVSFLGLFIWPFIRRKGPITLVNN